MSDSNSFLDSSCSQVGDRIRRLASLIGQTNNISRVRDAQYLFHEALPNSMHVVPKRRPEEKRLHSNDHDVVSQVLLPVVSADDLPEPKVT